MYRDMVPPNLLEKLIVSGEEGVGTYRGTKKKEGVGKCRVSKPS